MFLSLLHHLRIPTHTMFVSYQSIGLTSSVSTPCTGQVRRGVGPLSFVSPNVFLPTTGSIYRISSHLAVASTGLGRLQDALVQRCQELYVVAGLGHML